MPRGDRRCILIPQLGLFDFVKTIGKGSFSEVFQVRFKEHPMKPFALKCLHGTTQPERVKKEVRILKRIGGKNNIIKYEMSFRKNDRFYIALEYFPHVPFQEFCEDATMSEIRDYMKNLLIALRALHARSIIHHDLKPSNFLFDRVKKRYALIDFGLAEEMAPPPPPPSEPSTSANGLTGKRKLDFSDDEPSTSKRAKFDQPVRRSPRKFFSQKPVIAGASSMESAGRRLALSQEASTSGTNEQCQCFGHSQYCKICMARPVQIGNQGGTAGFRAPETLMCSANQTSAIDIWACGVILASLLSRRYPFMKPRFAGEGLVYIMNLLGTQSVYAAGKFLGIKVTCPHSYPRLDLRELCCLIRLDERILDVEIEENDINGQSSVPCVRCSSNLTDIPTSFSGRSFCLCYRGGATTNQGTNRGPLFVYCQRTDFNDEPPTNESATSTIVESTTTNRSMTLRSRTNATTMTDSEDVRSRFDSEDVRTVGLSTMANRSSTDIESSIAADSEDERGERATDLETKPPISDIDSSVENREIPKKRQQSNPRPAAIRQKSDGDLFDEAFDLLNLLLEVNPGKRIQAIDALRHKFFLDR